MFQHVGMGLLLSAVSLGSHAQVVQNMNARQAAVPFQAAPAPASAAATPAPVSAPAAAPASSDASTAAQTAANNSTMAELQQLIQNRSLNELRTTYNGNYGASLLFKADDLTYYVALFQQKNFWRVIKTGSEAQAEQSYKAFVDQTAQLADVDIRRIKLDAERAATQRQIVANEARLNTLQNDLSMQRQQEQQVAARQEQARQEAATLANEKQVASEQLNTLERQIRLLEEQQSKVDAPSASSPAPAAARRR